VTPEAAPFAVANVDGVATVTIDNGPINLFDLALYTGMAELSHRLAADDGVPGVLHLPLRRPVDPAISR
jgi:enoyl-CoA hydratase/carnithine racemase